MQGGVNSPLARITVFPRGARNDEAISLDRLRDEAKRFDQPDFNPNVHYILMVHTGHAGTEGWSGAAPRMKFSCPPEDMDAYLAAAIRRNPAIGAATDPPRTRRVRLQGLAAGPFSRSHGCQARLNAWCLLVHADASVSIYYLPVIPFPSPLYRFSLETFTQDHPLKEAEIRLSVGCGIDDMMSNPV